MAYLVCGLGQAGGKIVDEMFAHPAWRRLATPFAINSTAKDLSLLQNLSRANWVGISEDKGLVSGTTEGFEGRVVGGFGKDPEQASRVLEQNYEAVLGFFTDYAWKAAGQHPASAPASPRPAGMEWTEEAEAPSWKEERESIPFALIVVGLGGGTGCGIAGTVAKAIRESSSVNTTILAVGVLPATRDGDQAQTGTGRQAWNARFALQSLEPHVDGIILVDNECLSHTGNPETHFHEYNQFIANALVELFSAHLLEEIDLSKVEGAALPMVDIQDVRSALSLPARRAARRPGYASLGWGALMTRGVAGYAFGMGRHAVDVEALLATALRKQTVAALDPASAQKSLGLLRLPLPMVRKTQLFPDTSAVEARLASCSALDEVHFGITVTKRPTASLVTLLTYDPADLPRLQRIESLADAYAKRKGQP